MTDFRLFNDIIIQRLETVHFHLHYFDLRFGVNSIFLIVFETDFKLHRFIWSDALNLVSARSVSWHRDNVTQ